MDKTEKKKKALWRKIVSAAISILFIVAIICLGYIIIQLIRGDEPSLFGYRIYAVGSGSMSPTLEIGDVIVSRDVSDPKALKEGDVITFVAPKGFADSVVGKNITHRLVRDPYERDGAWYALTQGDNEITNPTPDTVPVPLENIRSVMLYRSGFLTWLFGFLRHWYGFVTLIVLPLVAVLIWQIVAFFKEHERAVRAKVASEKQAQIDEINAKIAQRRAEAAAAGIDAGKDESDAQTSCGGEDITPKGKETPLKESEIGGDGAQAHPSERRKK